MINSKTNKDNRPQIVCELMPHPQGAFEINGIPYRPTWPIGAKNSEQEGLLEIITSGINNAQEIYQGQQNGPRLIRVEQYKNTRRVLVLD